MTRQSRRTFLGQMAAGLPLASFAACSTLPKDQAAQRPNILFILTDDQGYGDLSCHGNPILKTPNIDRIAAEGMELTNFHSSPVCSPTRASLMTGRYNYRTGVIDTYVGRSLMRTDEITLPEVLTKNGYRTGIFGKWHLGDNYPMRAMDRGFQESLVIKGGGLCQPSEPNTTTYTDVLLKKNGEDFQSKGYCSDVYTDAAISFIEANASRPFYAYVPFNAPHTPLHIDERYWKPYAEAGCSKETARVYGMIANIDENVGRMLAALDRLGIADNTIVIFMTDNGATGEDRYNAGLRGQKGGVYEGGIRVPCFIRWPKAFKPGAELPVLSAHIDLFPTLLNAAGAPVPQTDKIDGISLLPLLLGKTTDCPDRTIFLQWHRGDEPQPYNNCAAINSRHKLVNGKELYDLKVDPAEKDDIAADHPDVVVRLREEYEAWFKDVGTKGYAPQRIVLGAKQEILSTLTRQDWRGTDGWSDNHLGWWEVNVAATGDYRITIEFPALSTTGEVVVKLNGVELRQTLEAGAKRCAFPVTHIPTGDGRFETWRITDGKRRGALKVMLERR